MVQQFDTVVCLVGAAFSHSAVATTCGFHKGLVFIDMDANHPQHAYTFWARLAFNNTKYGAHPHTHVLACACWVPFNHVRVVQQFDTVVCLVGAAFNYHVVATVCGHHEGLASMDMDASKPQYSCTFRMHFVCATIPNMGCIHAGARLQVLVGGYSTICVVQQFDTVVHLVGAAFNHCVVATTCDGHEGLAPMDMDASKPRESFNGWTHAQLLECLKWGTLVYLCLPTFDRWGLSNTCVVQQFDTGVVLSIVVE